MKKIFAVTIMLFLVSIPQNAQAKFSSPKNAWYEEIDYFLLGLILIAGFGLFYAFFGLENNSKRRK